MTLKTPYKTGKTNKASPLVFHQLPAMEGHKVLTLLLFGVLVVSVSCMDEEMAELAKMIRDNCGAETEVDMGLIDQVNGGADLMPDGKLKCYIKCVMETAGMMSEGEVDVEAVLALLPEDFKAKNEKSLRACGTQKGADDCDTAFQTQACWQKANKADYFLV